MKAELIPENGAPPIPITRDITVVGRRESCDLQIDHSSVSKKHCLLVRTSGLLILRDLASTNGTRVKGQRVRWAALLPGDKVTLGKFKARVYLGPDDAPSPSELYAKPPEPILTGFAPPTPPIVHPIGLDLPSENRASRPEDDNVVELGRDDLNGEDNLIGEDDGKWEKLPTPSGGNEFFIELD